MKNTSSVVPHGPDLLSREVGGFRDVRRRYASAVCGIVVSVLTLQWGAAVHAQLLTLEQVQAALDRPILEPGQPLIEMRAFLEPRIPVFTWPPSDDIVATGKSLGELRERVLNEIVFRGPRAHEWRAAKTRVEWLETLPRPGYTIQKLRYEVIPGMWVPALLYLPDTMPDTNPEKLPAVLNLSGHEPEGMVKDYKQIRCINLAKRGFAALNVEWFGMGQLRTPGFNHYCLNQIDLCGESGFAVFYLAMTRAFDLLAAHERVDARRIAVTGLSGGGLQTIFLAALDTRVAAANPVAGYCSLRSAIAYDDLGDSEHVPSDLATLADFTHLTAMVDPRPLLLTYNAKDDCCFQAAHSLPALWAATAAVSDMVEVQINTDPGTHNYDRENREAFYNFIRWALSPRAEPIARELPDWQEIPADGEILSADALDVPLPAANLDFNSLALLLAGELPSAPAPREGKSALDKWRADARTRLASLLKFKSSSRWDIRPRSLAFNEPHGWTISHELLVCQSHWSVPSIAFQRIDANSPAPVYLLADGGRKTLAREIHQELRAGRWVIAADPQGVGESQITGSDPWYLHALHVAVVGQRPLAIQAQQIQNITGYTARAAVHAHGPRMSVATLVAAALHRTDDAGATAGEIHLWNCPATLKELLEKNVKADEMPELLAFGLLAEFDILELAALAAPRRVYFHEPTDRHRKELTPLAEIYKTLGVEHDPLAGKNAS